MYGGVKTRQQQKNMWKPSRGLGATKNVHTRQRLQAKTGNGVMQTQLHVAISWQHSYVPPMSLSDGSTGQKLPSIFARAVERVVGNFLLAIPNTRQCRTAQHLGR